jgi:hypothetical protein
MPIGRPWSSGVKIRECQGVVRVPRRVFQRLLPQSPTPERCVEAYYLQRTRFESITERKLRRRQLTEDGNVEIDGQGLREGLRLAAGREQMSCHGTVAAAVVTTRRR